MTNLDRPADSGIDTEKDTALETVRKKIATKLHASLLKKVDQRDIPDQVEKENITAMGTVVSEAIARNFGRAVGLDDGTISPESANNVIEALTAAAQQPAQESATTGLVEALSGDAEKRFAAAYVALLLEIRNIKFEGTQPLPEDGYVADSLKEQLAGYPDVLETVRQTLETQVQSLCSAIWDQGQIRGGMEMNAGRAELEKSRYIALKALTKSLLLFSHEAFQVYWRGYKRPNAGPVMQHYWINKAQIAPGTEEETKEVVRQLDRIADQAELVQQRAKKAELEGKIAERGEVDKEKVRAWAMAQLARWAEEDEIPDSYAQKLMRDTAERFPNEFKASQDATIGSEASQNFRYDNIGQERWARAVKADSEGVVLSDSKLRQQLREIKRLAEIVAEGEKKTGLKRMFSSLKADQQALAKLRAIPLSQLYKDEAGKMKHLLSVEADELAPYLEKLTLGELYDTLGEQLLVGNKNTAKLVTEAYGAKHHAHSDQDVLFGDLKFCEHRLKTIEANAAPQIAGNTT